MSVMPSFLFLILSFLSHFPMITRTAKQTLTIEAITSNDGSSGYITGSQYLAFDSINNRSDILPNFHLNLRWHNTKNDPSRAICQAICISNPTDTCHPTKDCNTTKVADTIPIMLGAPTSSLSATISPILRAFDWAQISSSATSTELSEEKFSSFYRTIPSDEIQSASLVWLCTKYNWTQIAVLYPSDRYGAYLSNNIHELAAKQDIKVSAISYYAALPDSIESAAAAIKRTGCFIIVLIASPMSNDLALLFNIFSQRDLLQFPYYYIGSDSWFNNERIKKAKIEKYTKGFVGSVPWQWDEKYKELIMRWQYASMNDENFINLLQSLRVSTNYFGQFSVYGWDSAHAIAYALECYDRLYNLSNVRNDNNISLRLQSILKEDLFEFEGSTGYVSFDDDGNRMNGMYNLGNVIDSDGNIQYFATWNGSIHEHSEVDIIWPNDFIRVNMTPRSEKLITDEIVSSDDTVVWIFLILCIFSIFIVLLSICLQWEWRKNEILMAASWKLNILTCCGCILSHFVIIMYGWNATKILCNVREWFLVIAFSLVFMPLFMKTYRLSLLFGGMLKVRTITDIKLVLGVFLCLFLDCLIMSIFTAIQPDDIELVNGPKYTKHELWDVQQKYVYCVKGGTDMPDKVFVAVIASWKAVQLLFGLCVALVVSRISLEYMQPFNETNSQIFAILFTIAVALSAAIPIIFRQVENPTQFYLILGICGLLISNVVLIANVLPRLWAVFKNNEAKFKRHEEDAFKAAMKSAFKNRDKRELMDIIHEAELLKTKKLPQRIRVESVE